MRILITGVAGFIGAHVARRCLAEGAEVIGVDDLSGGNEANIPAKVDFIRHDLADPGILGVLPQDVDYILHLAGQSSGEISFDDPILDLKKNTVSTLNLIRHGIDAGARKLLYASSMSVYGDVPDEPIAEGRPPRPLSCYGVGKFAAENYLRIYEQDLPWLAMRMFNVYGPGQDLSNLRQGMVSIFLKQALDGGSVLVKGGLERFRDFIHVEDVVDVWIAVMENSRARNMALNVGTGRRASVEELLKALQTSIPGMDWHTEGNTPGDQMGIYADTARLVGVTGKSSFKPLEEGLGEFVDWARTLQ